MPDRLRRWLRRRAIMRKASEIRLFVRRCIAFGPMDADDVPSCSRDTPENLHRNPVLMAAMQRHQKIIRAEIHGIEHQMSVSTGVLCRMAGIIRTTATTPSEN